MTPSPERWHCGGARVATGGAGSCGGELFVLDLAVKGGGGAEGAGTCGEELLFYLHGVWDCLADGLLEDSSGSAGVGAGTPCGHLPRR